MMLSRTLRVQAKERRVVICPFQRITVAGILHPVRQNTAIPGDF